MKDVEDEVSSTTTIDVKLRQTLASLTNCKNRRRYTRCTQVLRQQHISRLTIMMKVLVTFLVSISSLLDGNQGNGFWSKKKLHFVNAQRQETPESFNNHLPTGLQLRRYLQKLHHRRRQLEEEEVAGILQNFQRQQARMLSDLTLKKASHSVAFPGGGLPMGGITEISPITSNVIHNVHSKIDLKKKKRSKAKRVNNDRMVVVHVGPHKTGTTTIQSRMKRTLSEMYEDGYEIPGDYTNKSSVNMLSLTNCFLPKYNYTFSYNNNNNNNNNNKNRGRELSLPEALKALTENHDFSCNTSILEDIRAIANGKSDMFLSAESFSFHVLVMERLQELFEPFGVVHVIAYYRRFYEWLHSLWNQSFKELAPDKRPTFAEWVQDSATVNRHAHNNYILGLVPRWEKYFPGSVALYNMHMLPYGIVETFFCVSLPHATKSCQRVREVIAEHGEGHANPSRTLVYKDLAFAAKQLNLIQQHENITEFTEYAQEYQEEILKLSQHDFPHEYKVCPNEDILFELLQLTLDAEEKYFPEYFFHHGENEINDNFELDQTTKLCNIDAYQFLKQNATWQKFFTSL